MDNSRRKNLHTDAGGDYDEENAVCYLSILLADFIERFNRNRMMNDMNRWGYCFVSAVHITGLNRMQKMPGYGCKVERS